MFNWPEEVPLKDKKKGISGLDYQSVQRLYDAIHDKEKPLHFRRLGNGRIPKTTTADGVRFRKRTIGDRDDSDKEDMGPSEKRSNMSDAHVLFLD